MKAVVGHRLALLGCALLALSPAGARAAPLAGCPTSASFAGASFKSTFDLPHAATARFGPALPASSASAAGSASLLLTTFGVGASADSVQVLPQPAAAFNAQSLLSLDASTAWPNEIAPVPKGANVSAQGITFTVAGGFFAAPSKATGEVALVNYGAGGKVSRQVISTPKKEFFYHHVAWLDVDGDATLDIVAARAKFPTVGKAEGELVWLFQSAAGQWQEQVLASGPDVYFTPADRGRHDGDCGVAVLHRKGAQHLRLRKQELGRLCQRRRCHQVHDRRR